MRDKLPAEILDRPKHGFEVPVAKWLKGELRSFAHDHVIQNVALNEYFDHKNVEKMWHEHQRGTCDWSAPIWALLMFSLWHEQFIK